MRPLESKAFDGAVTYLRKAGRIINILKIVGTIFGAAIVAVSPFVDKWIGNDSSFIEVPVFIFGLVLTIVSSVALVFLDQTTPQLIKENLDIIRKNDELRASLREADKYLDHLLARTSVNSQVRELIEEAIVQKCGTLDQAKAFAHSIISIFAERRHSLFGIADEFWNFGVYYYDNEQNKLDCIACRREDKEEEETDHRAWDPGNGHVGLAFQRSSEIIFSDATVPELQPVLEARGENKRENDATRYVSLASIPITTDGTKPLGVLVATSDQAGRFKNDSERKPNDWENVDTLREVAANLAIILQMIQSSNNLGGSKDGRDTGEGADRDP